MLIRFSSAGLWTLWTPSSHSYRIVYLKPLLDRLLPLYRTLSDNTTTAIDTIFPPNPQLLPFSLICVSLSGCSRRAERPMKVEIAIDPNAMQSLASRVNVPAAAAGGRGAGRAPAAAKPRNGGRAAGSGRAPKPRAPRPAKKTAEDLDAEMAVSRATSRISSS